MKYANEYTITDLVEAIARLHQDVMANRETLVLLQDKVKKLEQDLEEVSDYIYTDKIIRKQKYEKLI